MAKVKTMSVEIAYARPDIQVVIALEVPVGTTLGQTLELSRIRQRFPEIDLDNNQVGIFGELRTLSSVLNPGDRVEVYRPLLADPRVMRRQRAAANKRKKLS